MKIPLVDIASMHAELQQELDEAWHRIGSSGSFIGGKAVEDFEDQWAEYCCTRYCVGVSSGTAALELSLSALGIGPGDEVIVPACTFIATAAAVTAVGAEPVFVDVDPATLLMTPDNIRLALSGRSAAIIVVHLYGQPADMVAINAIAEKAGICVIEDAAQAHGASRDGKKAGSQSSAGCFSFYPGKNLGAFGDAGAVVTNDRALADKIRSISNHGRHPDDQYRHDIIGANYRLDALQAALLTVKLTRLDAWNEGRRRAAKSYADALADLPVELVTTARDVCSSHHLAVIQTPHRAELRRALAAEEIATNIHYPIPCHLQAPYASRRRYALPVAERAAERILTLPMFPHLTDAQIGRIATTISRSLATCEREARTLRDSDHLPKRRA